MSTEETIINIPLTNNADVNDSFTTEKIMNTGENKNSFEWVWYVIGLLTGMLAVLAVTTSFGYVVLGGILGLIFAAIFLNKIVKGREY